MDKETIYKLYDHFSKYIPTNDSRHSVFILLYGIGARYCMDEEEVAEDLGVSVEWVRIAEAEMLAILWELDEAERHYSETVYCPYCQTRVWLYDPPCPQLRSPTLPR